MSMLFDVPRRRRVPCVARRAALDVNSFAMTTKMPPARFCRKRLNDRKNVRKSIGQIHIKSHFKKLVQPNCMPTLCTTIINQP